MFFLQVENICIKWSFPLSFRKTVFFRVTFFSSWNSLSVHSHNVPGLLKQRILNILHSLHGLQDVCNLIKVWMKTSLIVCIKFRYEFLWENSLSGKFRLVCMTFSLLLMIILNNTILYFCLNPTASFNSVSLIQLLFEQSFRRCFLET